MSHEQGHSKYNGLLKHKVTLRAATFRRENYDKI